jgi:hypothetical protein
LVGVPSTLTVARLRAFLFGLLDGHDHPDVFKNAALAKPHPGISAFRLGVVGGDSRWRGTPSPHVDGSSGAPVLASVPACPGRRNAPPCDAVTSVSAAALPSRSLRHHALHVARYRLARAVKHQYCQRPQHIVCVMVSYPTQRRGYRSEQNLSSFETQSSRLANLAIVECPSISAAASEAAWRYSQRSAARLGKQNKFESHWRIRTRID